MDLSPSIDRTNVISLGVNSPRRKKVSRIIREMKKSLIKSTKPDDGQIIAKPKARTEHNRLFKRVLTGGSIFKIL